MEIRAGGGSYLGQFRDGAPPVLTAGPALARERPGVESLIRVGPAVLGSALRSALVSEAAFGGEVGSGGVGVAVCRPRRSVERRSRRARRRGGRSSPAGRRT